MTEQPSQPVRKWYYSFVSVIVSLILFGPLAYPLLWKSPEFNRFWKIVLTVVFTLATVYVVLKTWDLVNLLLQELKSLGLI